MKRCTKSSTQINSSARTLVASGLIVSLATSSCSNLTPEQNAGIAGIVAGTGALAIARHNNVNPAGALAIGLLAGALAAKITYDFEVRKATATQARIARNRAVAHQSRIARERKNSMAKHSTSPSSGTQTRTQQPSTNQSRYIAVQTQRTSDSTGSATVMIYDTQSGNLVNNNAYDIKQNPRNGELAKLDNYDVQFVSAQ